MKVCTTLLQIHLLVLHMCSDDEGRVYVGVEEEEVVYKGADDDDDVVHGEGGLGNGEGGLRTPLPQGSSQG